MRQTIRKLFWAWDFDKEEKWLNEMAAKGLSLISVGFCKYEFEDSIPGEYKVCTQLLKKKPSHPESRKYIEFLETTGAEHVGSYMRWVYVRRKATEGNFELFSDNDSRIKYLSEIISLVALVTAGNLIAGIDNVFCAIIYSSPMNYIGILNIILGSLCAWGVARLMGKRKKMKQERNIFE